jgi:hypothetical protein
MEKLISCCGLNCATCDARIATVKNDDELRKATAEKWKVMYGVPDMNPEMINCTGCREEGVKLAHCSMCQIRVCVADKGYETCADCEKLESCELVSGIHKAVPEALMNLKSLKN